MVDVTNIIDSFPTLPPLSQQQVQAEQWFCSSGKGLTADGFSDTWLRSTQRWELLADLWNPQAIHRLTGSFEARLVALNKVWPDIPRVD